MMHTPDRRIAVFQEGRLAGEIGVRPEHNPFLGTDLAETWEEGRKHGELNHQMFKREMDHHFGNAAGPLARATATVLLIIVVTILILMGY